MPSPIRLSCTEFQQIAGIVIPLASNGGYVNGTVSNGDEAYPPLTLCINLKKV